jgi:murein DD-endopeptidase MepM/ murein hydrolase activator NlpD
VIKCFAYCWIARIACVFIISIGTIQGAPQFLTLPFSNPDVSVRQGWVYDSPGPFICSDFPANVTHRCHKGIDYLYMQNGVASSFEVVASAPGRAIATQTLNGYGYFIFIEHDQVDEFGRKIFTLYAHVAENSWTVPFKPLAQFRADVQAGDFSSWMPVGRGDKIAMAGNTGGWPQIHLHFEVQLNGYAVTKADPYDIYGSRESYPAPCQPSAIFPPDKTSQFPSSFWTECPPSFANTTVALQPGPTEGKDIWTTSVYSYASCSGSFPGGGLYDSDLRVGGWGDFYYTLLQFDLTGLPVNAKSATLQLYCYSNNGGITTPMYLDRITQYWWNWQTSGTGCDHDRLWWADRPPSVQWTESTLLAPVVGQWYSVDITDLYNGWQNGQYSNYGIQLRPVQNGNNFNFFYSSRYADDPTLRPKLVIQK